jgi:hypothetical protein
MVKQSIALLVMCAALMAAVAKDNGVVLKINYAAKQKWTYGVSYTSQGNFRQKSSNTAKATEIHCILSGVKKDDRLVVKADSVTITSDLYADDVKKEMREKLLTAEYPLSLAGGFPSIDTGAAVPVSTVPEWDLYRQLAKLLPILPVKPVKPGFTWERTSVYPMKTSRGKVSCEVYRTYSFDKLSGDTATVSWKFRYAGNDKPQDSAAALNEIPVFGTGNGTAVLDIRNGCILDAEMNFTTPVATIGNVSVVWHENLKFAIRNMK